MPVYEYRCPTCRRRTSELFLTFAEVKAPECPRCHQPMQKQVSLFSTIKSEDARMDEVSDDAMLGDVDENDPRSVARWARRMGKEMGEDLGPEFDEMVDALERGEDPEGLAGAEAGQEDDGDLGDAGGAMSGLDE